MHLEYRRHFWGSSVAVYFKASKRTILSHGCTKYINVPPTVLLFRFSRVFKLAEPKSNGLFIAFGHHYKGNLYATNLHGTNFDIACGSWVQNLTGNKFIYKKSDRIKLAKEGANTFWQSSFSDTVGNNDNVKVYLNDYIKINSGIYHNKINISEEELENYYLNNLIDLHNALNLSFSKGYINFIKKYNIKESNIITSNIISAVNNNFINIINWFIKEYDKNSIFTSFVTSLNHFRGKKSIKILLDFLDDNKMLDKLDLIKSTSYSPLFKFYINYFIKKDKLNIDELKYYYNSFNYIKSKKIIKRAIVKQRIKNKLKLIKNKVFNNG